MGSKDMGTVPYLPLQGIGEENGIRKYVFLQKISCNTYTYQLVTFKIRTNSYYFPRFSENKVLLLLQGSQSTMAAWMSHIGNMEGEVSFVTQTKTKGGAQVKALKAWNLR